jgi:uncharacterized protein DUF397
MSEIGRSSGQWRKSSYSGGNSGQCVEVAFTGEAVGIRDSKDPHGPRLVVAASVFHSLVMQLKTNALGR